MQSFYLEHYVKTQAFRFKDFSGFEKYNFNYIYEVRSYNENHVPQTELLSRNNVPIPSFLRKIGEDYDQVWNKNVISHVSIQRQILPKDYYNRRDLLRVIREAFSGFVSYPSTLRSNVVSIMLSVTKKGLR